MNKPKPNSQAKQFVGSRNPSFQYAIDVFALAFILAFILTFLARHFK